MNFFVLSSNKYPMRAVLGQALLYMLGTAVSAKCQTVLCTKAPFHLILTTRKWALVHE